MATSTRRQGRQEQILRLLAEHGSFTVHELATRLQTSVATVRRDLAELSRVPGRLERGWGAVSVSGPVVEQNFAEKLAVHRSAKRAIGRAVAAELTNGQVVAMNGGTTTTWVARAVVEIGLSLTVITNAVNLAYELAGARRVQVVLLGGTLRSSNYETIGPTALSALEGLWPSVAVLGCSALSATAGACTEAEAEAEIGRAMAERADAVWVVADKTKLGRASLVSMVPPEKIGRVFTDGPVSGRAPLGEIESRLTIAPLQPLEERPAGRRLRRPASAPELHS